MDRRAIQDARFPLHYTMPAAVVAGLNRPAGTLDASQALAPYRGPWNQRTAAHLLRRAGFGGTPAQQRALAAMSPHAAVESLVHFSPATGAPGRHSRARGSKSPISGRPTT